MLRAREGWDTYSSLGQLFQSTNNISQLGAGRISGQSLYMQTGGGDFSRHYIRPLGGSYSEGYHGVSFRIVNATGIVGNQRQFAVRGASVQHLGWRTNSDRSISVVRDATVLATSAPNVLVVGAWHRVELFGVHHDTTGQYALRVDGNTVIPLTTNVDTRNAGDPTYNEVIFGCLQGPEVQFDDYTFNDSTGSINNSWLGDLCIETIRPDSDVSINWTRNTGSSNWSAVDDATVNTGDFLTAASLVKDTLGLVNLTGNPASILGLGAIYHADKTGAGASDMRVNLNSGGSVANGTTRGMNTTAFTYQEPIVELDPQGSVAWSVSRVNALNIELDRVA